MRTCSISSRIFTDICSNEDESDASSATVSPPPRYVKPSAFFSNSFMARIRERTGAVTILEYTKRTTHAISAVQKSESPILVIICVRRSTASSSVLLTPTILHLPSAVVTSARIWSFST